jgi:hypothetical protein
LTVATPVLLEVQLTAGLVALEGETVAPSVVLLPAPIDAEDGETAMLETSTDPPPEVATTSWGWLLEDCREFSPIQPDVVSLSVTETILSPVILAWVCDVRSMSM